MELKQKRILLTGGGGFLGSKIVSLLKEKDVDEIIIPNSKNDDLRIQENCSRLTKDADIVIHLAAKVGGIGLNQEKPGELFYDNLMMGTQLIEESRKNGVQKVIALGTICSYPKFTVLPFSEKTIWDGYPEETNAPYGLAKKMLLVQSDAYRQQYKFNSIVVFPTNLYGPNDNFNDNSSHVIPALIKKIINAINNKEDSISLWGDGTPTRDFLYVDDAAKGIILAAEKYDKSEPINLGTGIEVSIKDLVKMILEIMNVNLKVNWETGKPGGQPRRCIDFEKAKKEIGFEPEMGLRQGLEKTIDWYKKQKISLF